MRRHRSPSAQATLLWVDPGVTTGLCLVNVDSAWLAGVDSPTMLSLRNHLTYTWHAHIGAHPLLWDDGQARPLKVGELPQFVRGAKLGTAVRTILGGNASCGGNVTPVPLWLKADQQQVAQFTRLLSSWPEAAWGVEDFEIRKPNSTRDYSAPIRLIAGFTAAEVLTGPGRIPFIQTPASRVNITDERLRAAGLHRPGMVHANDAARHAVNFLRKARGSLDVRAAAWPHLFGNERGGKE